MTAFKTDASEFISEVERVRAPAPGFVHEYERAQIMTSRSWQSERAHYAPFHWHGVLIVNYGTVDARYILLT